MAPLAPSTGECPDEETMVLFLEGILGADAEALVRRHVNGCATCRAVLAESVRDLPEAPLADAPLFAGRYRLEGQLGAGVFGPVFRAHDVSEGRDVVLRVLRPELARDKSEARRFERQARSAAALVSPHAVRIFAVERTPSGEPFVVMERLTGWTLAELLERNGPVSLEDAVRFAREACHALAEAHARGMVHGHLKPKNLFFASKAGEAAGGCIKVLDFGAPPQRGERELTSAVPDTVCDWMSPEQIGGRATLDHRSDIWSLGATLYTLLCARPPFVAATPHLMRAAIVHQAPAPLAQHRRDVPPAVDDLLAVCLRKLPAERCSTIVALANALQHAQRATVP